MSTSTSTVRATLKAGSTPVIYNKSAPSADTEVSQALSGNTKKFTIRVRAGKAKMRLGFSANSTSSGSYITIPAGNSFSEDLLDFSGTLYFQTNLDSQVVEILEWT